MSLKKWLYIQPTNSFSLLSLSAIPVSKCEKEIFRRSSRSLEYAECGLHVVLWRNGKKNEYNSRAQQDDACFPTTHCASNIRGGTGYHVAYLGPYGEVTLLPWSSQSIGNCTCLLIWQKVRIRVYNGNWTEWSAIWSEIIPVISKSNEFDLKTQVWLRTKIARPEVQLPLCYIHFEISQFNSLNTKTNRKTNGWQICQTMSLSFIVIS